MPIISPINVLREAQRSVPAVRYAGGVAGVASVVAIVAGFQLDYRIAVFGTIIVFGLMFVLVVFSALASNTGPVLHMPAIFMAWSFALLTVIASSFLLTSYFFEWPRSLESYIPKPQISYTDKKPKIIGIYPKDLFGPLQKDGLWFGKGEYCDDDVEIIDINKDGFSKLKDKDISSMMSSLKRYLDSENIMSISGPSITEITKNIMNVNRDTKNVPIFITSAAPKRYLDWDVYKKEMPLFRISTGVDVRARDVSRFIELIIDKPGKMRFLVQEGENGIKSFGQIFLDEIKNEHDDFLKNEGSGHIEVVYFKRNDFEVIDINERVYFEGTSFVFYLGVGHDYKNIVKNIYKENIAHPVLKRPKLITWMHSHTIDKEIRNHSYYYSDIIEITDLDITAYLGKPDSYFEFEQYFAEIGPNKRDEAFSFDAAMVICSAYENLKSKVDIPFNNYIKFDEVGIKFLEREINDLVVEGVTGNIHFRNDGSNSFGKLVFSKFNGDDKWINVDPSELLSDI